jgi:hypothetical protein
MLLELMLGRLTHLCGMRKLATLQGVACLVGAASILVASHQSSGGTPNVAGDTRSFEAPL